MCFYSGGQTQKSPLLRYGSSPNEVTGGEKTIVYIPSDCIAIVGLRCENSGIWRIEKRNFSYIKVLPRQTRSDPKSILSFKENHHKKPSKETLSVD